MTAYAWLKSLHLVFVIGWFAGLFYLPRIYVNLADPDDGSRARLRVMARKLLGFMTGLVLTTWIFGRRAERAVYSQIEGQPGAAAAALNMLRRSGDMRPSSTHPQRALLAGRFILLAGIRPASAHRALP